MAEGFEKWLGRRLFLGPVYVEVDYFFPEGMKPCPDLDELDAEYLPLLNGVLARHGGITLEPVTLLSTGAHRPGVRVTVVDLCPDSVGWLF